MRHLVFALALVLSACTSSHAPLPIAQPPAAPVTSAAPADLEGKTVALVAVRAGEGRAYCSGVWIAPDAFVTANHCVDDLEIGTRIEYATRADVSADHLDQVDSLHLGELFARDPAHDLALVRVRLAPAHGIAAVAAEAPYVGEYVQTMGHPLGLWWSYSAGLISGVRQLGMGGDDLDPDMWWVQSTAPISPGNSGGGLFNARGELLGICHAYMPRGQSLYFYVHGAYVQAFLDRLSA